MRFAQLGLRHDGALLPGAEVPAVDVPVLPLGVQDPRFDRINLHVKSVGVVNHGPVFVGNAVARQRLARSTPASVVLQSAADVIGLLTVQTNLVKLPDGNGVDEIPGAAVVVAPVNSAITAGDDVVGGRRIDPHGVKV